MLIRLLPVAPHPTILFAVTFQNLPADLPLPWAWANQLNTLSLDDLEHPQLLHCLDPATAITSLLEEVVFNLPLQTISCRFIDGSMEEWPMLKDSCLKLLNRVISDVNESAIQTERERVAREVKQSETPQSESLNSPPASVKSKGHKKQRSLLMSLVASIVSPSPRPSSPASSDVSVPVAPLPSPPPISLKPKALRRRARSTLVDAYRLHVQPEVNSRMSSGGFYIWIVESMLRRTANRLDQLTQSGGIKLSTLARHDTGYSSLTDTVSTPYEDDGDLETDTDGSSVRTPSSHFSHTSFSRQSIDSRFPVNSSRPSSSNVQQMVDANHETTEYRMLANSYLRLKHLLVLANARQAHADREQKQRESVLEIRSRRRAWLNKSLTGNAATSVGLAMPFKSSRLAQTSWSADDYEFVPPGRRRNIEDEEYHDKLAYGLRWTRGNMDAKLFPLAEEEAEYGLQMLAPWNIDNHDDVNDDDIPKNEFMKQPRFCTTSTPKIDLDIPTPVESEVILKRAPLVPCEVDSLSYDAYSRKAIIADQFPVEIDVPCRLERSRSGRKAFKVGIIDSDERDWFAQVAVDCR